MAVERERSSIAGSERLCPWGTIYQIWGMKRSYFLDKRMRRLATRCDIRWRNPAAAKCPDTPFSDDRSRDYRVRHQKKASSIPRMERICIQWPGDRVSGTLARTPDRHTGRPRSRDDKASFQRVTTKIDDPLGYCRLGAVRVRLSG